MFARAQVHPEPAAGDCETRSRCGDPYVARDCELTAGADRGSVDRRDHRRWEGDDRVQHELEGGPERVGRTLAARLPVGESGHQIGAGTERGAGSRYDDGPQVRVVGEDRPQLIAQVAVECVAALLAVDRDEPDQAASFELDHGQDSSMSAMRSPSCTVCSGAT